jgi:ribosomal protein L7/L12
MELPDALPPAARGEIDALLRAGSKIQAIKVIREHTGLGLAEAKAIADRRGAQLAEDGAVPGERATDAPTPPEPGALYAEIDPLIAEGQLIHAIKVARERTGLGLKGAKDLVEARRDQLGRGLAPPPGAVTSLTPEEQRAYAALPKSAPPPSAAPPRAKASAPSPGSTERAKQLAGQRSKGCLPMLLASVSLISAAAAIVRWIA